MKNIVLIISGILLCANLQAQTIKLDKSNLVAHQAYMSLEKMEGQIVLHAIKDSRPSSNMLTRIISLTGYVKNQTENLKPMPTLA